jgi:hypothetical protein
MKAEVKQFPRSFRSSSAAYRAVRQYEAKMGLGLGESGIVMTKVGDKNFLMSKPPIMSVEEFNKKHPLLFVGCEYRYFPDGVKGEGYYELKTGDRRRPNSKFMSVEQAYSDLISGVCELQPTM